MNMLMLAEEGFVDDIAAGRDFDAVDFDESCEDELDVDDDSSWTDADADDWSDDALDACAPEGAYV